jgi:uncharacterized membrane protein YhaH (DUF805 family)
VLSLQARRLENASMALMLLGIVALCQPWSEFLHRYSILITIVGLVAFNVFSRITPPPAPATQDGH